MTGTTPRVDGALWDRPVAGTNLVPGTLGDQLCDSLGDEVDLFVFLRHFG